MTDQFIDVLPPQLQEQLPKEALPTAVAGGIAGVLTSGVEVGAMTSLTPLAAAATPMAVGAVAAGEAAKFVGQHVDKLTEHADLSEGEKEQARVIA